jgi:dTDP-4-dehydrorhamnose 3,5-epimerase
MKFIPTKLKGAFIIELDKFQDERGFFANAWDKKKFEENDLSTKLTECNIAFNNKKGTVRGFHYQAEPYEGAKLIRCIKGKILDITLDLRPNSNTFKEWISVELSGDNYKLNYVPEGCAHGYQTLEDNSEVLYLMSQEYMPKYEMGVKYSDPAFGISWPLDVSVISEKDLAWESF